MSSSLLLYKHDEICLNIENMSFYLLLHSPDPDEEEQEISVAMHTHILTELFACNEGKITIELSGRTVVLKPGEMLIVPPGIPHHRSSVTEGAKHIAISFIADKKGSPAGFDLYKALSPFFSRKSAMHYKNMQYIWDTLSDIAKNHKKNRFRTALRTVEILTMLSECTATEIAPTPNEIKSATSGRDIRRMTDLEQIINDFYSRDLTLEDIAKELFVSARQLDRIVRKRYGKTLRAVIADRRISAAEQLLITTDMNVDRISQTVGFRSKYGFYREFYSRNGTTPADWRNNNKTL